MSESEVKTIVGVCEEVSEKNGWTAFHIAVPGNQWPEKLSTKVGAIIEQGRAVGGEVATWTFKQSQGNENPNRPGTFYQNKYLEGVVAGATAEAQAASDTPTATASVSPARESTYEGLSYGDKERSIIRQTCIKSACWLYSSPPLPEVDTAEPVDWPLVVMQAADRFERWIVRDLSDLPF